MALKLDRYCVLQVSPDLEIEGLRVRFKVRRNGRSLDAAQLDVWGLDDATYGQIASPATTVRLICGYGDLHGELLQGQVVPLSLRRDRGESLASWQVQEAATALRTARLAASWPGPVKASEVLAYIAEALGVSAPRQVLPRDPSYAGGYVAFGAARDVLDTLAGDCGCRWYVQAGRLVLAPVSGSLRVRVSVLEPASGLIGWPEQVDAGRVRAQVLMEPGLFPGDTYEIGGNTLTGTYVAEIVEHEGDTHGDAWFTWVTGRPA